VTRNLPFRDSGRTLLRYSAFRLLGLQISPFIQNTLALVLAIITIFLASCLDDTLFLPGRDTGLMEHPAIFCYFLEQCIVPAILMRSVDRLWRRRKDSPFADRAVWLQEVRSFRDALDGKTNLARVVFAALLTIGITVWVWNSYSNFHPDRVGHDFWDSWKHQWGYWVTRLYKFYFWVLWIPSITHIQLMLILSVTRIVRKSTAVDQFKLQPYHPDGCGGTKALIATIFNPMMVSVLISAVGNAAAFYIHRRFDITTVGGVVLTCILFVAAYLWPAIVMRRAIVIEKRKQIKDVSERQSILYSELMVDTTGIEILATRVESLERLTTVARDIKRLPNWPHLRQIVGVASIAGSSPLAGWALRQGTEYASTFLRDLSI